MRLTLLRAKEALAKKSPADEIEYRLNRVTERILLDGNFDGSVKRIAIAAPYGQLALPRRFRAVEGVKVDGIVYELANRWYDYLPGKSDCTGFTMRAVIDEGDGNALMRDLPTDGTLAVVYTGDPGLVLTIYGRDSDGMPLTMVIDDATEHANTFASIDRVHKEQGAVSVKLRHTDADAVETTLALMEPSEEEVFLRRYRIDTKTTVADVTIEALVKLRHIEFTNDQDILPISNISALSLGLDALQMESENDTTLSHTYFSDAIELLNKELKDTSGEDTMPAIRFVYPAGTTPNFRSIY